MKLVLSALLTLVAMPALAGNPEPTGADPIDCIDVYLCDEMDGDGQCSTTNIAPTQASEVIHVASNETYYAHGVQWVSGTATSVAIHHNLGPYSYTGGVAVPSVSMSSTGSVSWSGLFANIRAVVDGGTDVKVILRACQLAK